MKHTSNNQQNSNKVRVLLPSLAASEATVEQLQDRVRSCLRVENQAAAVIAEALAVLTRREGFHATENMLREIGLRSPDRARSEVETAMALENLPKTFERLREGTISYENARIVAKLSRCGR